MTERLAHASPESRAEYERIEVGDRMTIWREGGDGFVVSVEVLYEGATPRWLGLFEDGDFEGGPGHELDLLNPLLSLDKDLIRLPPGAYALVRLIDVPTQGPQLARRSFCAQQPGALQPETRSGGGWPGEAHMKNEPSVGGDGGRVEECPPDALVPNPARRRLERVLKLSHTAEGEY